MSAKLDFPVVKIASRFDQAYRMAQSALDVQVLKDSNYFIPKDEGTLEASGLIMSNGGEVTWNTPYAREQYYERPNKSLDTNPNARMKWFEVAKAMWSRDWYAIVKKAFKAGAR